MDDKTLTAIAAAVIGAISGALGSLVAPWAQWGIERKRKRLDRQIQLIDHWRLIISKNNFSRSMIREDPTYGVLSELISKEAKIQIERPAHHIYVSFTNSAPCPDRDIMQIEVARIEKEWNLL